MRRGFLSLLPQPAPNIDNDNNTNNDNHTNNDNDIYNNHNHNHNHNNNHNNKQNNHNNINNPQLCQVFRVASHNFRQKLYTKSYRFWQANLTIQFHYSNK